MPGQDDAPLLALAQEVLERYRPDVLLCGLSSPGEAGIDEALLACRTVPAALVQDFWGEENRLFGRGPDLALVLDATAQRMTLQRHGTSTCITGSARHAAYANFDAMDARHRWRQHHGLAEAPSVWGWFGQPLQAREGYQRTLTAWASVVSGMQADGAVLYRPHPRESREQREWTQRRLAHAGLRAAIAEDCSTEEALATCDTACTVMSNCAYDAAYLNYFSDCPLLVPVLLLFDQELRDFYQQSIDIRSLPYVQQRLAATVWNLEDLPVALRRTRQPAFRHRTWQNACATLHDPTMAVSRTLDAVWQLGTDHAATQAAAAVTRPAPAAPPR